MSQGMGDRDKILEIRSYGNILTEATLEKITESLNYHDWKVRLEITKVLKKFIIDGPKKLQDKAMKYLWTLSEDIHPVVRLCVFEIRRIKLLEEEMARLSGKT